MAFLRKDYQYAKNILNKLGSYEDNYIFADFEEFIETKKKIIMTLNNVDELGAYKVLIKEYRDWIKKEPDKIFNYIILAYLLNKIKDYKNAEFMISKVEEISMHIPDAYYVKGLIYLDKGEKEKAKECFWRACLTIEHQFSGGVPAIMRFEKYLTWYNKL
ncbi:MAG TPA: hypothetical protein PKV21_07840 [bacterium]|nr:hypothetical protein [bacterium]